MHDTPRVCHLLHSDAKSLSELKKELVCLPLGAWEKTGPSVGLFVARGEEDASDD